MIQCTVWHFIVIVHYWWYITNTSPVELHVHFKECLFVHSWLCCVLCYIGSAGRRGEDDGKEELEFYASHIQPMLDQMLQYSQSKYFNKVNISCVDNIYAKNEHGIYTQPFIHTLQSCLSFLTDLLVHVWGSMLHAYVPLSSTILSSIIW